MFMLPGLAAQAHLTNKSPPWVDTVEKLSDEHRAGNNRIQVPRSLNQCCAPDSYLAAGNSSEVCDPFERAPHKHHVRSDCHSVRTSSQCSPGGFARRPTPIRRHHFELFLRRSTSLLETSPASISASTQLCERLLPFRSMQSRNALLCSPYSPHNFL